MLEKNREILLELFQDMETFAKLKNIDCPDIYLLGGSGCIMAGYLDRATTDIDFLDMNYGAKAGRLFKILERFDMLDVYLTTIPMDFKDRSRKLDGFKNIYVLSREDIIVSKIGRYSQKDIEDISILLGDSDINTIINLIEKVISRKNISPRVKKEFEKNVEFFRERFYV